jgi:hypothetical protein
MLALPGVLARIATHHCRTIVESEFRRITGT